MLGFLDKLTISWLKPRLRLDLEHTRKDYNGLGSLLFLGAGLIALAALLSLPSFEYKPLIYAYTSYCFVVFLYNTYKPPGLPLTFAIFQIPIGLVMIVSLQWLIPVDMVALAVFLFPLVFVFVFGFHTRSYIIALILMAASSTALIGIIREIPHLDAYLITTFGATIVTGLVVRKAAERTEFLAHYDAHTGLMNRRFWEQNLTFLLSLSERESSSLSLVFIDLDDFKKVNDTLGHVAGDALLERFAKIIRKVGRESDLQGRWGGDEFAIIMPNTSKHKAALLVDRIAKEANNIRFSAGVVESQKGEPLESLLVRADQKMYQAKEANKKRKRLNQIPVCE